MLSPFGLFQGVVLLGHKADLLLAFSEVFILTSIVVTSLCLRNINGECIPTFSPTLIVSCFLYLSHSDRAKGNPKVVSTNISLVAKNVEHFLRYSLAIFISSFENSVFGSIFQLLLWSFIFLILWFL